MAIISKVGEIANKPPCFFFPLLYTIDRETTDECAVTGEDFMKNLKHGLLELIGNTPLLRLRRHGEVHAKDAKLFAKLEYLNPAGSAKDRVARAMVEDAEARGLLRPGDTIIEPTSGNTGIGLAAVGAAKGYRVVLTMPDTMSPERRALLAAYGAEIVLTDGNAGMRGAIDRANELLREIPGSFMPSQFTNPANARAHRDTTGPEIYAALDGDVDLFVAGVGSGGTLTGAGGYLKRRVPELRVIAVEPADSPVLSGGAAGPHALQGIGAGFIPDVLDTSVIDEIIPVTTDEAKAACRALVKTEGILAGISSGAALHAATVLANRPEYAGKKIVVLLPDSGERYLSTGLFSD